MFGTSRCTIRGFSLGGSGRNEQPVLLLSASASFESDLLFVARMLEAPKALEAGALNAEDRSRYLIYETGKVKQR